MSSDCRGVKRIFKPVLALTVCVEHGGTGMIIPHISQEERRGVVDKIRTDLFLKIFTVILLAEIPTTDTGEIS